MCTFLISAAILYSVDFQANMGLQQHWDSDWELGNWELGVSIMCIHKMDDDATLL